MNVARLERTEELIAVDAGQILCVCDHPANRPVAAVVFCHGITGDRIGPQRLQAVIAEELVMLGFLCIRFDFRGSGDSSGEFEQTNFRAMQRDLRSVTSWVKRRHEIADICLLGVSIGGVMPALMATRLGAKVVVLLSSDLVQNVEFPVEGRTPIRGGEFYLNGSFFRERERLYPLTALSEAGLPTRLFYGERDGKLAEAALRFQEAGLEVERVKRVDHLFEDLDVRRYLGRRIGEFLRQSLRSQETPTVRGPENA